MLLTAPDCFLHAGLGIDVKPQFLNVLIKPTLTALMPEMAPEILLLDSAQIPSPSGKYSQVIQILSTQGLDCGKRVEERKQHFANF